MLRTLVGHFFMGAVIVLSPACRARSSSTGKGVVGKPGALSGETVALVLYEYSFDDPALEPTYTYDERTRKNITVLNGMCLYLVEYDARREITHDEAVELFKAARPVTAHAISQSGVSRDTQSFWEGVRSALSLRSNPVWVDSDLMQDEIYGMRDPLRQASLQNASTGIRTMRRYVDAAIKNEDQNGRECPLVHPRALQIPDKQ